MQDLILQNKGIQNISEIAVNIYKFCASVTPAIYRNKTDADMLAEIESTKLICSAIETPVLEKMCNLAVANYPIQKVINPKKVFDINYILEWYEKAYTEIWSLKKPNCFLLKDTEITEKYYKTVWEDPETGEIAETRELRFDIDKKFY